MIYSFFFFCMVHGDRSKGSTFLEMAEGKPGGKMICYCTILKIPLL